MFGKLRRSLLTPEGSDPFRLDDIFFFMCRTGMRVTCLFVTYVSTLD